MPRYYVDDSHVPHNGRYHIVDLRNGEIVDKFSNKILAQKYCSCLNYSWFSAKKA